MCEDEPQQPGAIIVIDMTRFDSRGRDRDNDKCDPEVLWSNVENCDPEFHFCVDKFSGYDYGESCFKALR